MPLALVARIPNLGEAQVAASALRAAGIGAEVFDTGLGGMEAPVIEGLGGYRLMAPQEDVAAARDLLKAARAGAIAAGPAETTPWAPPPPASGRRIGMKVVAFLFLGAPFILWLVSRLIR